MSSFFTSEMREAELNHTRTMTVLSVGYPLFPVQPDSSGGAEQILSLLDRELCATGCKSIVVAPDGSSVRGRLLPSMRVDGEITHDIRSEAEAHHARIIRNALTCSFIDLIHFHGLDFHTYIPPTSVPMLATLHLPLAWYPESIFQQTQVAMNCVSGSQAGDTGLPVVSNGIDTARFLPAPSKSEYFLWLGRVCPEKGVHLAVQAAKQADVELLIAGPVHPFAFHQQYFRGEVEPLLDERRRYLGAVEGQHKAKLLAEARGLIVTSLVAETSSLVAMEAASSGTAVIALRSGALPEVVEHGTTGLIASVPDQLPELIRQASHIAPAECRRVALERFSAKRMAADYLALYSRILGMSCAPHQLLYNS